jgi:DNA-binding protein
MIKLDLENVGISGNVTIDIPLIIENNKFYLSCDEEGIFWKDTFYKASKSTMNYVFNHIWVFVNLETACKATNAAYAHCELSRIAVSVYNISRNGFQDCCYVWAYDQEVSTTTKSQLMNLVRNTLNFVTQLQ